MAEMTARDAAWLTGQAVVLGAALVVVPATEGIAGRVDVPGARTLGTGLVVAGVGGGLLAAARLGRLLVPQPTPVADGSLVDTGPYGVVRHPIYAAVLAVVTGMLLRHASVAGLAVGVATIAFLDRKAAHEEDLLAAAYPEYAAYRVRVPHRLLPGLR